MISVIDGNLFDSKAEIICHQCNCQGVMGSGVAAEVKRRYPDVYSSYREDYALGKLKLGYVCFAETYHNSKQVIAIMCGQDKYGYDGKQYTHYDKLQECFDTVLNYASHYDTKPTIAFPYLMSCHRGGGDWTIVYDMIDKTFSDYNVEIWRFKNG